MITPTQQENNDKENDGIHQVSHLLIYGIIVNNIQYYLKNNDNYHNLLLDNHMICCISRMIGSIFIDNNNNIHNFRHNVPLYNNGTFHNNFCFSFFIITIFPLKCHFITRIKIFL